MEIGKLYTFWVSIDGIKDKEIKHQNFFDGYQKIKDNGLPSSKGKVRI